MNWILYICAFKGDWNRSMKSDYLKRMSAAHIQCLLAHCFWSFAGCVCFNIKGTATKGLSWENKKRLIWWLRVEEEGFFLSCIQPVGVAPFLSYQCLNKQSVSLPQRSTEFFQYMFLVLLQLDIGCCHESKWASGNVVGPNTVVVISQ